MTVTIGSIEIGGNNPTRFVAEMSNAHGGSLDRMLRMIGKAKDSGVDYIKTQCFTPEELCQLRGEGPAPEPWGSQGWSMRDLYTKAATPFEWLGDIAALCREYQIPWFSSVFGAESLAHVVKHGACALKIARLDNKSAALHDAVFATDLPVVVSEDISGESESDKGDDWKRTLTLYCPPGYPQAELGFDQFKFFPYDYGPEFDGFSYHGTSIEPPIVAATLGAKLIEAHFMLRDEPSELESNVSLDEHRFADMIRRVRDVEKMLA